MMGSDLTDSLEGFYLLKIVDVKKIHFVVVQGDLVVGSGGE